MATAISKPASHAPKMKRPPPPFSQPGVNGVKPQPPSSSPPTTNTRLPGNVSAGSSPNLPNGVLNMANPSKGAINRTRNSQSQKGGEQSSRTGRPVTRTASGGTDSRASKRCPEPYVKTTAYILKKYRKCPPSLTIHLHPTHFRFEQQDGSFPYNSEMKIIIEHLRDGTIPHALIDDLLRSNVRFYEGCLIVQVVDHKSVSAQARKTSPSISNENNTPFSLHNYNEHITPSAYVPYPKQNQLTEVQSSKTAESASADQSKPEKEKESNGETADTHEQVTESGNKLDPPKPRVFTTVLHPTARVLQAELTLLVTTPDPRAAKASAAGQLARTQSGSVVPQSPATGGIQPDRPAKRQKTLVEPHQLQECESLIVRALAPPVYLEPVHSFEASQRLLKFLEDPLHNNPPPAPKRRKRTVAELAADEALAAEEERFMLIMDERLEPTASNGAGGTKASAVDETAGVAPFEPRFSRFKTLETIRLQHEEKAKREHELKMKQELAKRQQQEQERERRRAIEQRQAEEHAKEEARRQQLAAQHAQAQIAAQQSRHAMVQANGVSQGQQSSPVVRNQTPHSISSPLVGNMTTQAVPMSISASQQSGSPPRPPSALQHAHPNMMSHPMAPSRSQQGPSRHGTPQMTQGTPAMSHATPIMRNVTPTQRMAHGSPNHSTMGQTPMMNHAIAGPQQMNNGMNLTPQQQQQLALQQRQAMLAQAAQQQGHMGGNQFTPQQLAQLQANAHAQQNIQSHQQQQLLQAQKQQQQQQAAQQQQQHQQQQQQQQGMNPQQQQNHPNMQNVPRQSHQAYQAQMMRAQFAQMQMVKQQGGAIGQAQGQANHGSPQQGMTPQSMPSQQQQQQQPQQLQGMSPQQQQQQLMMAAAQANGGQMPNIQNNMAARYNRMYHQRLVQLRSDMASRYMQQYGPPTAYPPQIAQQYGAGLEKSAKAFVQEMMRRERDAVHQQRANQQAAAMQAQQMQQQNMMQNGMGN
ncbi:Spt20 family [Penicillium malachiteum]|uniref:Spt20 family n=1 Tax=Penicillium malachiteum TaxID=1324776 RepID=UPI0025495A42|nr:Spt20 family [Penicillium malachiteum]KAJ5725073.1 Spt20 family [Penicillium malachiteum]